MGDVAALPMGDVAAALPALRAMLEDAGPTLLPVEGVAVDLGGDARDAGDDAGHTGDDAGHTADDAAGARGARLGPGVAVATSGSTGAPKRAVLPTAALRASATLTHEVLGGPGRWLLVLPPHHIAGLQVILRSLLAGHEPALGPISSTADAAGDATRDAAGGAADRTAARPGFTADAFCAALADARRTGPAPRYVSLVPTQLDRLLGDPAGRAALTGFDAVLVGGAATAGPLLAQARAAGVRVVTTYGMSETAGGCVYDGRPLPGVQVAIRDGRILLGGPTVARGYLGDAAQPRGAEAFWEVDGVRWYRTDDLGRLDDGTLTVLGRADDVIVTGGLKVCPRIVEQTVADVAPELTALVLGMPDPRWGEVVTLVLVTGPVAAGDDAGAPQALADRARRRWAQALPQVRALLPAYAVPRRVEVVPQLPLRGPGKPDRAALRALLAR